MESSLFSPIKIGAMQVKNRIFMSPMCQYSATDGLANEWHKIHYVSRAIGGVGAVVLEATAVEPNGRISPFDLGIWNDEQKKSLEILVNSVKRYECKIGLQLAHSGRKGSRDVPWMGGKALSEKEGGWDIVAPSPIPFDDKSQTPKAMTQFDIQNTIEHFKNAALRCVEAGFDFVEIHMAHGYLLHEFLSPLSNKRSDKYGGSFENRCRFPLEVAKSVRKIIPNDMPLFVRISASDWAYGGWDIDQSVEFVKKLKSVGVDFTDVSSGGLVSCAQVKESYGFQTEFASRIKKETSLPTGSVGMIVNAYQAEHTISSCQADAVFLGRALLYDPYWTIHAAKTLNCRVDLPKQYLRAIY